MRGGKQHQQEANSHHPKLGLRNSNIFPLVHLFYILTLDCYTICQKGFLIVIESGLDLTLYS